MKSRLLLKSIAYYIGLFMLPIHRFFYFYKSHYINKQLGGGVRKIDYPYTIAGAKNIYMENNVTIGPGATIYTTGAKLFFKHHIVIGPNLTIITGDHNVGVLGIIFARLMRREIVMTKMLPSKVMCGLGVMSLF